MLETLGPKAGAPLLGTVFVFWDIASSALPAELNLYTDADKVIISNTSSGILNRISGSPAPDTNDDGRSDLLVGATYADVVDGTLKIDAGRVFVIHGTPPQANLPGKFDVLANRTITGSGDYVVDKATGQPASFERSLPLTADESWFRFTTLA